MAEHKSVTFICEYCQSDFETMASLRSHKNNNRRCKEKKQIEARLLSAPMAHDVEREVGTTEYLRYTEEEDIHHYDHEKDTIDQTLKKKTKFDSSFALSTSFRNCISGRGLSNDDITGILDVVLHPDFDPEDVAFTTGRSSKSWLRRRLQKDRGELEKAKVKRIDLRNNISVHFNYFDPVKALHSLLEVHFDKSYFVKHTVKNYDRHGRRVYSSPETSDWWNDSQVTLQESLRKSTMDDGVVVLSLIFYSDACQLSGKGNKTAHPVVFSLANIPLYHRRRTGGYKLLGLLPVFNNTLDAKSKTIAFNQCLDTLMGPLKEVCESGMLYKGVRVFPLLFSYVHDYPEGCKVSATGQGNQVNFPCSCCYAPKENLNNITRGFETRTIGAIRDLVESNNETMLHNEHSALSIKCAFWGFKYCDHDFGNPYSSLMVDSLHQTDQGVFVHMMDTLRSQLGTKKLKTIESRHKLLQSSYWIGCLQLPASKFWIDGVNIQGFEHRAAMQVAPFLIYNIADDNVTKAFVLLLQWYVLSVRRKKHTDDSLFQMARAGISFVKHLTLHFPQKSKWMIPKIHAIQHYYNDIKRGGVTTEYSSEMWENLHKTLTKGPYKGTNFKNVEGQLMNHHVENWTLETMGEALEDEDSDDDATIITENVLPSSKYPLKLDDKLSGPEAEKWRRFETAITEYIDTHYEDYEDPENIRCFTSCEIGRTIEGEARDWTAYANPSHHGIPKYSFVTVQGEEDNGEEGIWCCRIICFLEFNVPTMTSDDLHQVAYVEYLKKQSTDNLLKCPVYVWEKASKRYKMVDLSNILQIVHMVPRFKRGDDGSSSSGEFYHNEFLFRNLKE